MQIPTIRRSAAIAVLSVGLLAAGCGSDDTDGASTTTAGNPSAATEETVFSNAWARTTPGGATNGAVYVTITAAIDSALVGASVAPSVAARAELHETAMIDEGATEESAMDDGAMDDGAMDDGAMDDESEGHGGGAMTMREVTSIALPAGEAVVLEPGGLHIMLFDLVEPLVAGEHLDVTLSFEDGQTSVVDVAVSDLPPAG